PGRPAEADGVQWRVPRMCVSRVLRAPFVRGSIVGTGVMLWLGCSGSTPISPTPPLAIVCPPDVSSRAALGANSAVVTFAAPTSSGGRPPVTTSCSQTSGSAFAVGSTPVTCSATDTAGHSASCSFSVKVDPPPIPQLAFSKYLGFGDSETEGKVSIVQGILLPNSYTLKLQPMLQSRYTTQAIVVADEGQGGEMVADPHTIVRFDAALVRETPQVVLIMDGANDLLNYQLAGIPPAISAIATLG